MEYSTINIHLVHWDNWSRRCGQWLDNYLTSCFWPLITFIPWSPSESLTAWVWGIWMALPTYRTVMLGFLYAFALPILSKLITVVVEAFDQAIGPTISTVSDPTEMFLAFFTPELIDHIAVETNWCASLCLSSTHCGDGLAHVRVYVCLLACLLACSHIL